MGVELTGRQAVDLKDFFRNAVNLSLWVEFTVRNDPKGWAMPHQVAQWPYDGNPDMAMITNSLGTMVVDITSLVWRVQGPTITDHVLAEAISLYAQTMATDDIIAQDKAFRTMTLAAEKYRQQNPRRYQN